MGWWGSLRDLSKNILKQGVGKGKICLQGEGVLKVSPPLPPPENFNHTPGCAVPVREIVLILPFIKSHSWVLHTFTGNAGVFQGKLRVCLTSISGVSDRYCTYFIRVLLRPCLHEYVFIVNDHVFNENAKIVLHIQIVFVLFSYCSLWRPFSKVIVFSRFRVDARWKRKEKYAVSMRTI